MSVDLSDARTDYADELFGDVATRVREGVADLEVVGLFAARQVQPDRAAVLTMPVGAFTFECPVGSDITRGDLLVFAGQKFNVVYAPPTGALDLAKVVGMDGI